MEKEIGSLEAGKKADLILIRTDAPHAVPMYNLYSQIVYALKASDVETVVIGGRVVMQGPPEAAARHDTHTAKALAAFLSQRAA